MVSKNLSKQVLKRHLIAILSAFSKVTERCIEKRLIKYLRKSALLSPHQFGCHSVFSTDIELLSFADIVKDANDSGSLARALFIGLTKTFDLIVHDIIE